MSLTVSITPFSPHCPPTASACPVSGRGALQHPTERASRLCVISVSPFPAPCNHRACTDPLLFTTISQPSFKTKVSLYIPQQNLLCPFPLNSIGSYVSLWSSLLHHLMMSNYHSRDFYMYAHLPCATPSFPNLA